MEDWVTHQEKAEKAQWFTNWVKAGAQRTVFNARRLKASAELAFTKRSAKGPPVGATFSRTISLPIIGRQTFQLNIRSRRLSQITLTGAMNLDEPAGYTLERSPKENGVTMLQMDFNVATLALLRRMRTKIKAVSYSTDLDYAVLVISAAAHPPHPG
eukprot:CAMPEP_0119327338 /NCGR_PEP_ID=MMETSP1333-20130426/70536_1 /TAXON_ID=418940 /ORGANISM="Scyphosphaera apsteinii, Strain RCC1455" /LENGTH=156 /DNA_ID=CAMNT_0007335905 /DNA_START=212 /DNA_END=681 /DNA_ORIENTATION=+